MPCARGAVGVLGGANGTFAVRCDAGARDPAEVAGAGVAGRGAAYSMFELRPVPLITVAVLFTLRPANCVWIHRPSSAGLTGSGSCI